MRNPVQVQEEDKDKDEDKEQEQVAGVTPPLRLGDSPTRGAVQHKPTTFSHITITTTSYG